jgi:hypothetical protein
VSKNRSKKNEMCLARHVLLFCCLSISFPEFRTIEPTHMIVANYNYSTGTIRADLAPQARPAQVLAGPEGRAVVLHLTPAEAVRLMDQLRRAVHWSERTRRT